MFQDYKDLLSAFSAHGVKYLIVGGYAVALHAQPRATKDIDLFIKADLENARAVHAALLQFGAPLGTIRPEDLSDSKCVVRFGREPLAVDILGEIPGVDFDLAWEHRVEAVLDSETGQKAHFISREDLLATKLASARPQDIADAAAIRSSAKSHKKTGDS